jgi:hypothetical protein
MFHKKIAIPDVRLYFHSAVNRDQPGENVVVTNNHNVICFAPIASVFRRRANNTQRPDVIVFTKNYTWINNGRWMNVIVEQFYLDFFERVGFGASCIVTHFLVTGGIVAFWLANTVS